MCTHAQRNLFSGSVEPIKTNCPLHAVLWFEAPKKSKHLFWDESIAWNQIQKLYILSILIDQYIFGIYLLTLKKKAAVCIICYINQPGCIFATDKRLSYSTQVRIWVKYRLPYIYGGNYQVIIILWLYRIWLGPLEWYLNNFLDIWKYWVCQTWILKKLKLKTNLL